MTRATHIASDADNVAAMVAAWTLMVGRIPGHRITHHTGIAAMIGNVPLAFNNFIVVAAPVADAAELDRIVAIVRGHAVACRYPTMLSFCADWMPAGWEDLLARAGLSFETDMTGMAADALLPPRRPVPAGLVLRRVDDVAGATALARLNAHAYGQDEDEVAFMCNLNLWRAEDSFGVVGEVDGRPVTTATAFVIGGMIYVALVATEPGYGGRGYAEAAMRQALALAGAAAPGARLWLHASDAGRPIYAAMGFVSGARTPVYGFG